MLERRVIIPVRRTGETDDVDDADPCVGALEEAAATAGGRATIGIAGPGALPITAAAAA
jgi:hypothetical protein